MFHLKHFRPVSLKLNTGGQRVNDILFPFKLDCDLPRREDLKQICPSKNPINPNNVVM